MNEGSEPTGDDVVVRRAVVADVPRIMTEIERMVAELRDTDSATLPEGAADACRRLVGDPEAGIGFVGEWRQSGEVAAIAVGSYHFSVRYGGISLYIQDYWIVPEARGLGIGLKILLEGAEEIGRRGVVALEGVAPKPSYEHVDEVRSFWTSIGGEEVGMHTRFRLTPERVRLAQTGILFPAD